MFSQALLLLSLVLSLTRAAGKPNIVLILTDDQDQQLGSVEHMPTVQDQLIRLGTKYERHYCQNALCCPSRASLLTGMRPHNTNVTDLAMPHGGYEKFVAQGLNDRWIAPLLQKAGYKTYYTGKLMNDHNKDNYNKPFPKGLDGNNFLIAPGTYNYLHPWFQKNKEAPGPVDGYATDLLRDRSLEFIDDGAQSEKPFFITIATVAPHASSNKGEDGDGEDADLQSDNDRGLDTSKGHPPIPAPRHKDLFSNIKIPDSKNFNPDKASGASWVKDLKKHDDDVVKYFHSYYRARLQALQAVDELVDRVIDRLRHHNELDNTYIIYSSDNGFHIGQHRLPPGKRCPYEEDINIPLIIRGPQVARGAKSHLATSHTDIVPTILHWAGVEAPKDLDGKVIPTSQQPDSLAGWEHTQVEHWGIGKKPRNKHYKRPFSTYKAVRVMGEGYNLFYSIWCTNEHEVYDMVTDPAQMENLYDKHNANIKIGGQNVGLKQLVTRLDTLLLVLKDCKGQECRTPWASLHPQGDVKNLGDALRTEFDDFYASKQKRIEFERCTEGYSPDMEGGWGFKTFEGR